MFYIIEGVRLKVVGSYIITLYNDPWNYYRSGYFFNNLLGFTDRVSRNYYIRNTLGVYCSGIAPEFESLDDLEKFVDYCKSIGKGSRKKIKSSRFKI